MMIMQKFKINIKIIKTTNRNCDLVSEENPHKFPLLPLNFFEPVLNTYDLCI